MLEKVVKTERKGNRIYLYLTTMESLYQDFNDGFYSGDLYAEMAYGDLLRQIEGETKNK